VQGYHSSVRQQAEALLLTAHSASTNQSYSNGEEKLSWKMKRGFVGQ